MGNQRQLVNPDRVILGRESRGLSQKNLASLLQVSQGKLSKIEQGLLAVSDEFLSDLSHVLKYPPSFFLVEGTRVGVGIAEIFHRKRQDVPKSTLAKIYAQMEIYLHHISVLQREQPVRVEVYRCSVDEQSSPDDVARRVRASWDLARGPIEDLTATVERAGIFVILMDFGTSRVDAISRWVPGLPPLLFVNRDCAKDRYRYSLAHELGHIVMHELPGPDIEEQANRFAAEFLLPAQDIRADLSHVSLAKLARLKQYWKVSMAALLMRARDLGQITQNQARYLWTQMAKLGYRTREPVELDITGERPTLLSKQIAAYLQHYGNSVTMLSEHLALNEEELRTLYLDEINELSGDRVHQQ